MFLSNPEPDKVAFQKAYTFLATLLSVGIQKDTWKIIQAVPELSEKCKQYKYKGSIDFDEAASDHTNLFLLQVLPYQSVFLDSDQKDTVVRLIESYRNSNFFWNEFSEEPDHISSELRFLAFLLAEEGKVEQNAKEIQNVQKRFLQEHLLHWLPALFQAVRREENRFYTEVLDLLTQVVLAHYQCMLQKSATNSSKDSFAMHKYLKEERSLSWLEDQNTKLSEIVRYLLTPACAGFYLSRNRIAYLSRVKELPRGFGSRSTELYNTVQAAVDYECFPAFLEKLHDEILWWKKEFLTICGALNDQEVLPFWQIWLARLDTTQQFLLLIKNQQTRFART